MARGPRAGAQPTQQQRQQDPVEKTVGQAGQQAYEQRPFQDQGVGNPFGDWKPTDWGKVVANDAGMAWGLSRQAYQAWSAFTDPNRIHQSVSMQFQGHDARSKAIQAGLVGGAQLVDWLTQGQGVDQQPFNALAGAPQPLEQVEAGKSPAETTAQTLQSVPREALNPLNYMGGEGKAGAAAMAAAPIIQSFLSADPDEQKQALIWATLAGGIFGLGHINGPARAMLTRLLGDKAPQILQSLEQAQQAQQGADAAAVDPQKRGQQAMEYVDRALQVGAMQPFSKRVAKAAGKWRDVPTQVGPEGQIRMQTAEQTKKLQEGLKKIGVADVEGLISKAETEGLSGKAMKWVVKNWKQLELPYDLTAKMVGETSLRDPKAHLENIADEELYGRVANHLTALNHYLAEINRGLFTRVGNPFTAILRSLSGETRNLSRVHARWYASIVDALGEWGQQEENGVLLMKAAEGDVNAYDQLPHEAKTVIDGFGLLRAWLRDQSQGTRYAKNFVPNWVPRLDTVRIFQGKAGRPTTGAMLAKEARKQRALALSVDQSGQLVQTLRYGTVQETNAALARARNRMQDAVLATDKPLPKDLENDPEVKEIRDLASGGQFEEAKKRLAQVAFDRFPSKDENFLRAIQAVSYQARSILTERAIQQLKQTRVQGKHLRSGVPVAMHALVEPANNRQREEFLNRGYVKLTDSKFAHVLAEPGFAKLLDRYVTLGQQGGLRNQAIAKQALNLERQMVRVVMYSPAIHGLNMLGRAGMAATLHPIDFLRYLMDGKSFVPEAQDASEALESEAIASGLLPNFRKNQLADSAISAMHNVLGDIEENMPAVLPAQQPLMERISQLVPSVVRDPYNHLNQWFWDKVYSFGVMMYHLEKQDALAAGLPEVTARQIAGMRANSWMGTVAPEDTNPMLHDASRLLFFAPNWWRTWAELMVPVYRQYRIFGGDEKAIRYAAMQGVKTMGAALLFQHMMGNALNLALSGHMQYQNQPGQQDRVQITRPGIIRMLQKSGVVSSDPNSSRYIDPETGTNPKTGAVLTMENPFARQQYATEQALGFQSGQPGGQAGPSATVDTGKGAPIHISAPLPPSGQDAWDGLADFAASRASPFVSGLATAANFDLYGFITSGFQSRAVIQGQQAGVPNWKSLIVAATSALPGTQQFLNDVQRTQDPNAPQSNVSLWGRKVPNGVMDWVNAIPDVGSRTALAAVTGINAPTEHAQRTEGPQLSDADYQRIQQVNDKYRQQMQAAELSAWSGQMTPYVWRQTYSRLSHDRIAALNAMYKNAPQYVNGGDALAAQWDALYDRATNPDGSIDQGALAQLQTQFRSQHTPEQMQQMNAIMHQNDTKYPMLALYHHVIDGYDQWQERWAAENGLDVSTIREEVAAYNALYSRGTAAQHQYLGQHPELAAYRAAIKSDFDRTPMGLAYGMFYGQAAAIREAAAYGVTAPQLEQAVQQQETAERQAA